MTTSDAETDLKLITLHYIMSCVLSLLQDTMGTWQKCVKATGEALSAGSSVVVDNTNPDRESRQRYIDAAGKVPCRCFVMATAFEHAKHNERVRRCFKL